MAKDSSKGGGKGAGGGAAKQPVLITGKTVDENDTDTYFSNTEWEKSLGWQERDAVEWYSGYGYDDFNRALREGKPGKNDLQKAALIDSAISKAELKEPINVYRGSSSDLVGGYSSISDIKKYMVGQTVTDKGFTSTSISKNHTFGGQVHYKITVPPGKGRGAYIRGISQHPSEREFLRARNTKYLITGVGKMKNGKPVVYMQVVD